MNLAACRHKKKWAAFLAFSLGMLLVWVHWTFHSIVPKGSGALITITIMSFFYLPFILIGMAVSLTFGGGVREKAALLFIGMAVAVLGYFTGLVIYLWQMGYLEPGN